MFGWFGWSQTIALLSHLAGSRCIWGPHLIVVPTSTLLNWDMEFKRWAPGFKVVTYFGAVKDRKIKRQVGLGVVAAIPQHACVHVDAWMWTARFAGLDQAECVPRVHYVVSTRCARRVRVSTEEVVRAHRGGSVSVLLCTECATRCARRHYLILDEAHYIKNFKSQRWQTLLTFSTRRRLLLTGTPLQNSLMELWSLMHFLMPHLFRSQAEFKQWFATPLTSHVEGTSALDQGLVRRLHAVLRPFLLRRLKSEVAKQLPQKFEHVVACRLSNRQR